ncbi:MAG: hypothetical protein KKI02_02120 [Planctomycetes bacterium]|nr:hypothetical protein [Planctomycetota bacterium]
MCAWRAAPAVLLALVGMTAGCNIFAPIAYYLRPPQIQKPQYEFPPDSPVAIVIEARDPRYENPVFNEALHERMVTMLRDGKSQATILPLREVTDLRQANADFAKWSLQRIGRTLRADHVLYIKIDRLVIHPSPEYPILAPEVDLHIKLIGVNEPAVHARIWPEAKEGHAVSCRRQVAEAADTNPDAADIEGRKLGYDTAYWVTMPFIKVDLEKRPPVER